MDIINFDPEFPICQVSTNLPSNVAFILYLNISSLTEFNIKYACKNKDDCARDFAKTMAIEMLQRQYDISKIKNELKPLISTSPSLNKPIIDCYNSNENIRQCGTSAKPHPCLILN
ncbi:unnamed protein product, partial [Rotaria sordida]